MFICKPLLQFGTKTARLEKFVAKQQHMPVRVVFLKNTLIQQTFAVPNVVGDLCFLLFGTEFSVLHFDRDYLVRKSTFIIGNKEDAVQRYFYRTFDAAERKSPIRFPRGKICLRFQSAFAPFGHSTLQTFVYKKTLALT